MTSEPAVGDRLELDVGPVAHGGICIARYDGRVVFVRHALPGERILARLTDVRSRYWRADAVEILVRSPDRVPAPCPFAGPGRCGGCDWQHASLPAQRELKAAVVAEQLRRLAGLSIAVKVEPVPGGPDDGLGWRTRANFAVSPAGRAGLRRHRSHEIEPIGDCLIAHRHIRDLDVPGRAWPGAESVAAIASSTGERSVVIQSAAGDIAVPPLPDGTSVVVDGNRRTGRTYVTEQAAGRTWRVSGGGFWQVHPGAADVLVDAVIEALEPRPGERVLDLYAGVGLFAGALAARVGPAGSVVAVESNRRAVTDARRNLHDLPWLRLVPGRVDRALPADPVDVVVLDPPRTGAGADVVRGIAGLSPRAVAYVACDPAALARDVATFAELGYLLRDLRAFDLFPMTHHVECIALFEHGNPQRVAGISRSA
ncbi:MAG TPA: class I SAM-dependent RNA methyltransferase [Jiangellaceae bacterium]